MVGAVVVEVVVELVGDGGELLEEVVGVLFAAGLAGVGEEVLDGFVAGVEELDEDEDAIVGEVGGVAELLDLAFGEGGVVALCACRGRVSEESEGEEETASTTGALVLVVEDLGEDLVVDLVELLEGGLEGGLVFAGGCVEVLAEAVGGVVHEHLGVLEALAVAGESHVDELRVVVDLLERGAGLVDVAVEHLLAGDFGHGVDELGVEEALFARAGLLGADVRAERGPGRRGRISSMPEA